MKATVVVPYRNKAATLEGLLRALERQSATGAFEVVLVDDASTPPVAELLDGATWPFPLRVERAERPGGSTGSAARARNLGLAAARGEIVLFLDADVLPSPLTVERHLAFHRAAASDHLLMSQVFGQEGVPWELELRVSALRDGRPGSVAVEEVIDALAAAGVGGDPRSGRFAAVGDRLDRFPAPWAWCWTLAVSCPRAVAEAHPFDETFAGKGSEDLEWGYRLHHAGVAFAFERRAPVLHWPHERDRFAEIEADRANLHRFLGRHPRPEVEALAALDCVLVHDALPAVNDLVEATDRPLAESADDLPALEAALSGTGSRLLLGAGDGRWDGPFTAACEPARRWRRDGVLPLVGLATPFATGAFDAAVVGSLGCRLHPVALARLFQEALRVARRVFVYAPDDVPHTPPGRAYAGLSPPYWVKGRYCSTELEDFRFAPGGRLPTGRLTALGWTERLARRAGDASSDLPLETLP